MNLETARGDTGLGKVDIFAESWVDIVFTGRNKAYGAYDLRRNYNRNLMIGLALALVIFILGFLTPKIAALIKASLPEKKQMVITEVNLEAPPSLNEELPPPPPPVEPPPPVKNTIRFTIPEIKKEEVNDPPPAIEEIEKDVEAGKKTQVGDNNAVVDEVVEEPKKEEKQVIQEEVDNTVYTIIQKMPQFPGGEAAMMKFISENIKYPPMAKEAGIKGTVIVTFIVDREGNVTNPQVLKGIGGGCDEEALRVIKMMPKWSPGEQNGKKVLVKINVPIRFVLR
ncbi:MAG: energy transducer TonB [Bacteroidia bacterium]|nr:energy transducer TonB [Bacteroidia bacterium]